MAKTEKPKFSAPCLVVACPSCHVPEGCACRVIDMTGTTPTGTWAAPREPHLARENEYRRWKIRLFGDPNDVTTGHKLPYVRRSDRRSMQPKPLRTVNADDGLSYVQRAIGVGLDPPGSGE